MNYLGDYKDDGNIVFRWNTNDKEGASITRATDGTIKVYKDDGTSQTTGVTDDEDTPAVGIHKCTIDLSAHTFYEIGHDYSVVVEGAVVDGETINSRLAEFSIENRVYSLYASAARVLTNKAVFNKVTGVVQIYNDVGTAVILTLTPTEDDSQLTRTPS